MSHYIDFTHATTYIYVWRIHYLHGFQNGFAAAVFFLLHSTNIYITILYIAAFNGATAQKPIAYTVKKFMAAIQQELSLFAGAADCCVICIICKMYECLVELLYSTYSTHNPESV